MKTPRTLYHSLLSFFSLYKRELFSIFAKDLHRHVYRPQIAILLLILNTPILLEEKTGCVFVVGQQKEIKRQANFFLMDLFIGYARSLLLQGLSLLAASGGYSSLQCMGLSLRWLRDKLILNNQTNKHKECF